MINKTQAVAGAISISGIFMLIYFYAHISDPITLITTIGWVLLGISTSILAVTFKSFFDPDSVNLVNLFKISWVGVVSSYISVFIGFTFDNFVLLVLSTFSLVFSAIHFAFIKDLMKGKGSGEEVHEDARN